MEKKLLNEIFQLSLNVCSISRNMIDKNVKRHYIATNRKVYRNKSLSKLKVIINGRLMLYCFGIQNVFFAYISIVLGFKNKNVAKID